MALYAFDGTWNDSTDLNLHEDNKTATNVHRFRCLYEGTTCYLDGVGSRFGLLGKYIGGATGFGAIDRIAEQFFDLKKQFEKGDATIDIIGYSRGAAIARMFTHKLAEDYDQIRLNGEALSEPPTIRFLGLFDTVASFGVPWTENEHNFEREVPEFVENTFHAMALDEVRETFGIERCLGNLNKITEVWFRGGHGDIGGNATYVKRYKEVSNRERSDIALDWMLKKAKCVGLPVADSISESDADSITNSAPPVTASKDRMKIGNVGTLSRRIHTGDLVHHSLEKTHLTRNLNGLTLRRIDVMTRIEDVRLENSSVAIHWVAPHGQEALPDNEQLDANHPSLVNLSLRRYPFDVPPARTWAAWLDVWKIEDSGLKDQRDEFWAPTDADRKLAWEIYVELQTRITVQQLADDEGDDKTALTSVYRLFPLFRETLRKNGVESANAGLLINTFLNQKVRPFTAKWHKRSIDENWKEKTGIDSAFRKELRELQEPMEQLSKALSTLSGAKL